MTMMIMMMAMKYKTKKCHNVVKRVRFIKDGDDDNDDDEGI